MIRMQRPASATRLSAWVACWAMAAFASAAQSDEAVDPVVAYLAIWNGSSSMSDRLLTDDFVDRSMLLPLDRGMFGLQVAAWRRAAPGLRVTLVERARSPGREVLRLRYEGEVTESTALLTHSGKRFAIEQTEWLTVVNGRIESRQAYLDEWTLPAEWMFAAPPATPFEPYAARTIATLAPGQFLESIAVGQDGRLFVSTGFDGGISIVGVDGTVTPHARVDVGPGGLMMCLAFDAAGVLHATVNSRNDDLRGVWRFAANGRGLRIAALPSGAVPNGIAIDPQDDIYVADSFGGVIWKVPSSGGAPTAWLRHAWLTPRPLVGRYPGANGLQYAHGAVYVAVSDRGLLLRIPVAPDGSAGTPEILSSGLPADDFAVAPDGTLFVTTHPFDTVVRITPDGRRVVVAGAAQGFVGPTAAAFAKDGGLIVVTDGGLYRPLPGVPPVAAVLRLDVPR